MSDVGRPAPSDIFTDNHRWGDLDDWHRTALALHAEGGLHRIERDSFTPFWMVVDHAAVLDIERQPELFTNGPEPVLLAENPDQLAKVQANPELIPDAVEEMIRWTSPVRHVMRTAREDTEVAGQEIKAGDWLTILPRLGTLELAGDPTTMKTTFVGGHKTRPIRYTLASS